jgi:hypothetical protein
LKAVRDEKSLKLVDAMQTNNIAGMGNAIKEFQSAFKGLASYELENHSTLSSHVLVGASVDSSGLVIREHLMPGTQFHHDWIESSMEQEGRRIHWKVCPNCNLGFFKVDGDPRDIDGWSQLPPESSKA